MTLRKTRSLFLLFAAFAFVLAACGGTPAVSAGSEAEDHGEEDAGHDEAESDHDDEAEHGAEEFTFGSPADSLEADRTIDITAHDDFTFSPGKIDVIAGETITFRIVNTGSLPHDFTIGDKATQDEHEAEMAEMMANGEMMMHDDPNAVVLAAGEAKEITWVFPDDGTVLIGCHQPGHYAAGMIGEVSITS